MLPAPRGPAASFTASVSVGDIHVVEQHHVGEAGVEHFAQLRQRIDLDLDLDQMAGMRARALQHRP